MSFFRLLRRKTVRKKISNELLAGQLEFFCEIRFAEQIDE